MEAGGAATGTPWGAASASTNGVGAATGPAHHILAFGTFDPLHEGHQYFLTEAKKYGNHLTVIVTRDQHIEHFKHRQPRQNENERLAAIRALPCVDETYLSDQNLDWANLSKLQPNLIILGFDQNSLAAALPPNLPIVQLREMIY